MENPLSKENIISVLGIESLPDAQKSHLINVLTDLVQHRVAAKLFEIMPDAFQPQLAEMLDNGDSEGLSALLLKQNIDFIALIQQEADQVKKELADMLSNDPLLKTKRTT